MTDNNFKITYSGKSDIGLVRKENQDSFGIFLETDADIKSNKGIIFVVADGIGGHSNGKEASCLAVESVKNEYFSITGHNISDNIKGAFKSANKKIFDRSLTDTQFKRMGTTCSALVIKDNKGCIAHVGDSKIFRISDRKITQLTCDHTLVGEMMKHGVLTEKEAKKHPNRSTLLRAMGGEPNIEADIINNIDIRPGDCFVICTDGLANLRQDEIITIVCGNSPPDACDKLVELANARGGKDNVTVIVIKINGEENKNPAAYLPADKNVSPGIIWVAIILAIILIALLLMTKSNPIRDNAQIVSEPIDTIKNNTVRDLSNQTGIEELYQSAVKFQKAGKLNSALKNFNSVLKINPTHMGALNGIAQIAEAYKSSGKELSTQKKYEKALSMFEKSKAINTSDNEIYDLIAECKNHISKDSSKIK